MNKITEELLWKFIDGDCTEEEKTQIQKALEQDEALRRSLAERQALHEALQKIEEEAPSMRFATNVMENLPKNVWSWRPLVTPRLIGKFILGLSASVSLCVLIAFTAAPTVNSTATDPVIGQVTQLSNQIFSSSFSSLIVLLTIGAAMLYLLDRYLKNRFSNS